MMMLSMVSKARVRFRLMDRTHLNMSRGFMAVVVVGS
jgi:hypothetical protein